MDELQQLVDVDAETEPARERDARRAVPPAQPLARRADGCGVRVARRIVDDVVALPWFVLATTGQRRRWAGRSPPSSCWSAFSCDCVTPVERRADPRDLRG